METLSSCHQAKVTASSSEAVRGCPMEIATRAAARPPFPAGSSAVRGSAVSAALRKVFSPLIGGPL